MSPPAGRLQHPIVKLAGFWSLLVVIGFGLALVAAHRVGAIDPDRVRAGSALTAAGQAVLALVAGWLAATLLYGATVGFDKVIRALEGRLNRPPTAPTDTESDSISSVVRAGLVVAGTWAAFRWLTLPLVVVGHGPVAVPLMGVGAGSLLIPITVGFGLEALLGLWRLTLGVSRSWIILRLALRIGWMIFLFLAITGRDLFRGDPLEWAAQLGSAGELPGDWLQAATLAVASLWPVAQVAMAGALLIQGLALLREVPGLWRAGRRPESSTP